LRNVTFTDGVRYVADTAGAYWLVDIVAITQRHDRAIAAQPFQHWKLGVADNASAVVTCDDGNGKEVYQLAISWTDFPREAPRISQNGVLAAKPQHEMRVQPRMR
jgi:hypothetical protein